MVTQKQIDDIDQRIATLLTQSPQLKQLCAFWTTHMGKSVPWHVTLTPINKTHQKSPINCCVVPNINKRSSLTNMSYILATCDTDAQIFINTEQIISINIGIVYGEMFSAWSILHYHAFKEQFLQKASKFTLTSAYENLTRFIDHPPIDTI